MSSTLLHAYTPFLFWTGLGLFVFRFLPSQFPRWIGRWLYWCGVPIEIFALTRHANLQASASLAPSLTIAAILVGAIAGLAALKVDRARGDRWIGATTPQQQGSFLICCMLGNTGFVGLSIVPFLITSKDFSWAVFYTVVQNVFGTYGLGVLIASYFGRSSTEGNRWLQVLKDIIIVPSLWAFILSISLRSIPFSEPVEIGLDWSIQIVIPIAFLLMGIRLSQIHGWQSLRYAIVPTIFKTIVMPLAIILLTTLCGVRGESQLMMVVMSGVPCAFNGLVLAEEYDLDRPTISSAIVVSTIVFLAILPIWLFTIR